MSDESFPPLSDEEMDLGFWSASGGWYRLFVAYMATYEPIHDIKRVAWHYGPDIDAVTVASKLKVLKSAAKYLRAAKKEGGFVSLPLISSAENTPHTAGTHNKTSPLQIAGPSMTEDADDGADIGLFDLNLEGLAGTVTPLKRPRTQQPSPRRWKGKAKQVKATNWAYPSETDSDEEAGPSGYERPALSLPKTVQPRAIVEVSVPCKAIDKSKYASVESRSSDEEGMEECFHSCPATSSKSGSEVRGGLPSPGPVSGNTVRRISPEENGGFAKTSRLSWPPKGCLTGPIVSNSKHAQVSFFDTVLQTGSSMAPTRFSGNGLEYTSPIAPPGNVVDAIRFPPTMAVSAESNPVNMQDITSRGHEGNGKGCVRQPENYQQTADFSKSGDVVNKSFLKKLQTSMNESSFAKRKGDELLEAIEDGSKRHRPVQKRGESGRSTAHVHAKVPPVTSMCVDESLPVTSATGSANAPLEVSDDSEDALGSEGGGCAAGTEDDEVVAAAKRKAEKKRVRNGEKRRKSRLRNEQRRAEMEMADQGSAQQGWTEQETREMERRERQEREVKRMEQARKEARRTERKRLKEEKLAQEDTA